MAREVFVDAGAWIALSDARDGYYASAMPFYRQLLRERRRLVTTNLAVAEAHILIRRAGGYEPALRFLQSVRQSNHLLLIYVDATLETQAIAILRRYTDQDFSLTDAVSFAVMQERGITEAFAFDRHFLAAGFVLVPAL